MSFPTSTNISSVFIRVSLLIWMITTISKSLPNQYFDFLFDQIEYSDNCSESECENEDLDNDEYLHVDFITKILLGGIETLKFEMNLIDLIAFHTTFSPPPEA